MMPQAKVTYRSICREYLHEDPARRRARGRPRTRLAINVEIESEADDKVALFRLVSELAKVVQETKPLAGEQKMYDLPPPNF